MNFLKTLAVCAAIVASSGAAAATLTTIDFETTPTGTPPSNGTRSAGAFADLAIGSTYAGLGATFGADAYFNDTYIFSPERRFVATAFGTGAGSTPELRVDFSVNVNFVSANIGTFPNLPVTLSVFDEFGNLLGSDQTQLSPFVSIERAFELSVSTASNIAYATFSRGSNLVPTVDEITFGEQIAPVPLPAGMPLLLVGLAAFGLIRRKAVV